MVSHVVWVATEDEKVFLGFMAWGGFCFDPPPYCFKSWEFFWKMSTGVFLVERM